MQSAHYLGTRLNKINPIAPSQLLRTGVNASVRRLFAHLTKGGDTALGAYACPSEDEDSMGGRNGEQPSVYAAPCSRSFVGGQHGVEACLAAASRVNSPSQIKH